MALQPTEENLEMFFLIGSRRVKHHYNLRHVNDSDQRHSTMYGHEKYLGGSTGIPCRVTESMHCTDCAVVAGLGCSACQIDTPVSAWSVHVPWGQQMESFLMQKRTDI